MFKYVGADKKFKLTSENYYTQEASEHYMSIHPFISFIGTPGIQACEERVISDLENPIEPTDNMLIGSYVDSYYEGTLDEFKTCNPQLFKKDGSLLAKFEVCNDMIAKAETDDLFKFYMTGEKQKIYTGTFAGLDWKIKVDNLVIKDDKIVGLVDLKTCKDIHARINDITFIEMWGYDYQLALYQEILKQNIGEYVPCYIAAISKEEGHETAVIYVDDDRLKECREAIESNIDRFKEVITRNKEAERCGLCSHCKATRINEKVINYRNL